MSERTLLARKKPFTGDPQRLSVPRPSAMALTPSLGPRPHLEPLNYPPGAPRKLDIAGYTICPTSEKERVRPDQAQKLGQDSLDLPEHFQGGLRDTEPSAGHPRLPTPSSHEDPLGGKHCEVYQEAITLDQDLEVEVDSDWPGPGGVWGPWVPSSLPTPAELEWDPAGDIGGFGPLRQKTAWTPGASCELCGHRGPQSWGRSPEDMLMLGLSHRKHLGGHQRCSLLQKSQNKKKRASSNLQDVLLEVDSGAPAPTSRRPLTFLLLFLLFLLLVGTTMFLPQSEGLCCSPARLARTPYLVLSYVNGPPPNLST
ncbi:nesprin-4 isoform X4 [Phyllostomus discolor]|uniref:Nesprin-4 isoform X4 n=1 Tax=Phyllostomus discolor TaxID=89673 RepID=A0A7E6CPS5_9CHIR|nr:nesprin-4 isoform X4 [Phyllostomus discolor]